MKKEGWTGSEGGAFPLRISFQTSFWGMNGTAGENRATPGPETAPEHSRRVNHTAIQRTLGWEEQVQGSDG